MARIHITVLEAEDASYVSLAVSLCFTLCMLALLLGIKIWWFKHRLTFDHSATTNGADGGSPPAVPPRQRNHKDKRSSQQYRTSVEVHGVFRKRPEDDIDVARSIQLPPIGARQLSQSTPSLLLPVNRLDTLKAAQYMHLQPPTREPPKAPIDHTSVTIKAVPPTQHDSAQFPTGKETALPVYNNLTATKEMHVPVELPPQAPKRYQRHNSTKVECMKTTNDLQNDKYGAIKPTPLTLECNLENLRSLEDLPEIQLKKEMQWQKIEKLKNVQKAVEVEQLKVPAAEICDASDSGYARYESAQATVNFSDLRAQSIEVLVDDIDPVKYQDENFNFNMWSLETELRSKRDQAPIEDYKSESVFNKIKYSSSNSLNRETLWQNVDVTEAAPYSYAYEEPIIPIEAVLKHAANTHSSVQIEEITDEQQPMLEYNSDASLDSGAYPLHCVKFNEPAVNNPHKDKVKEAQRTLRLSSERADAELWRELVKNTQTDPNVECLWLEMQKDINNEFPNQIDEEFNRIRHSYHENEGAFLELCDEMQRYSNAYAEQPKGYGKSIDEDWEHFEALQKVEQISVPETKKAEIKCEEVKVQQNTKFMELQQIEEFASELSKRAATAYNDSAAELYNKYNNNTYENEESKISDFSNYTDAERQRENSNYKLTSQLGIIAPNSKVKKNDNNKDAPLTQTSSKSYMQGELKTDELIAHNYCSQTEFEKQWTAIGKQEDFSCRPQNKSEKTEAFIYESKHDQDNQEAFSYRPQNSESEDFGYNPKASYNEFEDEVYDLAYKMKIKFATLDEGYEMEEQEEDNFAYKPTVRSMSTGIVQTEDENEKECYSLKKRSPTVYMQRSSYVIEVQDEEETRKEPPQPMARKNKSHQKVTFDINTEEHHYPSGYPQTNDTEENYYNDEEQREESSVKQKTTSTPKPMQRMTKTQFAKDGPEESSESATTPILFSTQVSTDERNVSNDNWSAIRQHRYLTDEFEQQMTLKELPLLKSAPRPANRNPLAHWATSVRLEHNTTSLKSTTQATPQRLS